MVKKEPQHPGSQYTALVYNGSTRLTPPISDRSRLIPELEKTLPPQSFSSLSQFSYNVPNITVTRRHNAIALYQEFLQERISAGEAPKGLDQSFAAMVQISPSMWSQVKSSRPIGDKLARQLENRCRKSAGWLDERHEADVAPDAAEERFIEAARRAWRAANAKGKRELLKLVAESPV